VDDAFLKSRTVNKDAIYKIQKDGVTHTYVADPFVVGLMKLDPIGYTGVMDAPLRAVKSGVPSNDHEYLAPFFAPTASTRTFEQALVTAPAWSRKVLDLSQPQWRYLALSLALKPQRGSLSLMRRLIGQRTLALAISLAITELIWLRVC
jgi:hypothetical protein